MQFLDVLKFLVDYGLVLLAVIILLIIAYLMLKSFMALSKEQKEALIKSWLLNAVMEAEKELGSGTGEAKLAKVWKAFLSTPILGWLAFFISFDRFKELVDEALVKMRKLLETNEKIRVYVEGR